MVFVPCIPKFDIVSKWAYNVPMNCKYCERPAVYKAKQMCRMHYHRWLRTKEPEKSQQGKRFDVKPVDERIRTCYVVLDNGCWEWTEGLNQYGYGKVKWEGRTFGAHRVSWYLANNRWPEADLDHVCHTLDKTCVGGVECRHRRCINPDHLEEVSRSENSVRKYVRLGIDVSSRKMKVTTRKRSDKCRNGHEYAEGTFRITVDGNRLCKICEQARVRRKRQ